MTTIRAVPRTHGMSPSEGAVLWAVRLDRGSLSQSEEAEFAEWLADPLNDEALSRATDALHVFDADRSTDPHLRALRQAALEAAPAPAVVPTERRYPLLVAASVATIGIAIALLMGRVTEAPQVPTIAKALPAATVQPSPQAIQYASSVGKRRTVSLPDGSTVTLNTNSQVAVSFTEGRRMIRLVRGQALFDVAHNPERPFIVSASGRTVTALGTFFGVRLDPGRMQVVLVNGKVVVDREGQPQAAVKASDSVVLEPGQGFVADESRGQRVIKVDMKRELLWRSGFVEFDDESLVRAVAEINRYTERPIELGRDGVANLHVSGVFRTDDPRHFVETISELLPIESQPTKQGGIKLSLAKKAEP